MELVREKFWGLVAPIYMASNGFEFCGLLSATGGDKGKSFHLPTLTKTTIHFVIN